MIPAQPLPRRVPREVLATMAGAVGQSTLLPIRPAAFSQPADHGHHPAEHGLHAHGHHGHGHSHLPPGTNGQPIAWRSLLALGISGGLLPCPSALVVLLSAISLHQIAFGLLLIVAFSTGLAGVLTGIGLLLVYAGRLFSRLPSQGWVIRLLPVGSALVVAGLGAMIVVEALTQAGVWRF